MTQESTFDRINREHREREQLRREREQRAEAPNQRYAEVVARLRERPQFETMAEKPWTAPLVAFRCPACGHPIFEARLDLTQGGDPFLRATPDDTGATADGWEGFLSSADSHGDPDAIVKDKPRLRCQHRKASGAQCRYDGRLTQERLLAIYEVAVEQGEGSIRLPS